MPVFSDLWVVTTRPSVSSISVHVLRVCMCMNNHEIVRYLTSNLLSKYMVPTAHLVNLRQLDFFQFLIVTVEYSPFSIKSIVWSPRRPRGLWVQPGDEGAVLWAEIHRSCRLPQQLESDVRYLS